MSADPSALPEGEAQGKREALTALPACQLGPVRAPPHLWPARACSHGSVHRPPPLACCRFARVLEWLVPHDAAQGRYVNPTNACQSFQPHPSAFNAFSGFEGAKWHRLCRPSGNPLGLNPAGVLPFRMRAHRRRQPNQCACQSFQPHPSTFAFSGFEGAKRHRLSRPSGNPLGPTMLPRAVTSTQPMPAKLPAPPIHLCF